MPRAFGFDGDSAYHESLEAAVRASEAKRREEKEIAEKERRKSLGLPEDGKSLSLRPSNRTKARNLARTRRALLNYLVMTEPKTRSDKRKEKKADPARKKSVGEKVSNFLFNAGRPSKAQKWGEERVGMGDGEILKVRQGSGEIGSELRGQNERAGGRGLRHGEPEVIR